MIKRLNNAFACALVLSGSFLSACGEGDPADTDATADKAANEEPGTESHAETRRSSDLAPSTAERLFTAETPWNTAVSDLPKSDSSDDVIQWLADAGGWGTPRLRIEFSIKVLNATASTPFQNFTPTDDFYTPDCDHVPFPVPRGGAIEDEQGYSCTTDGDCHLLVIHRPSRKLYEMWRTDITNGFKGGCATVWDLDKAYGPSGRGEQCTSSDAGGFPVSAMVFTADEVAAGSIDHAIRFILPNSRIRRGAYVHPASHTSTATRGGPNSPPYGVRFRLRKDFPLETLPSDGARVIARALQKYGMLLSDGGKVPLTAADDRFTEHKWDEVGVGPDSVGKLRVTDFEVVGMGKPIRATGDCERE